MCNRGLQIKISVALTAVDFGTLLRLNCYDVRFPLYDLALFVAGLGDITSNEFHLLSDQRLQLVSHRVYMPTRDVLIRRRDLTAPHYFESVARSRREAEFLLALQREDDEGTPWNPSAFSEPPHCDAASDSFRVFNGLDMHSWRQDPKPTGPGLRVSCLFLIVCLLVWFRFGALVAAVFSWPFIMVHAFWELQPGMRYVLWRKFWIAEPMLRGQDAGGWFVQQKGVKDAIQTRSLPKA